MSERIKIDAQKRELIGKQVKQLRREGIIPAIIYGQQEAIAIQLERLKLRRVLREAGTTSLIDIAVDGGTRTVLARDVQQHVTRGDVLHVDFYEVNLQQAVVAEAAIVTLGMSAPEAAGEGATTQLLYTVDIEALPESLVSELTIDLSRIETADDVLYVSDLNPPDGVTILADPETPVAKFEYLREEVEEEEEEDELFIQDAEDVEVVARGKADEEEEESM